MQQEEQEQELEKGQMDNFFLCSIICQPDNTELGKVHIPLPLSVIKDGALAQINQMFRWRRALPLYRYRNTYRTDHQLRVFFANDGGCNLPDE